jgi:hypothetical protein
MDDFVDLARETFKRRTRGPLFIRHTTAAKRHRQPGRDRTDPSSQIKTIHINPEYRGKLAGATSQSWMIILRTVFHLVWHPRS